MNFNFILKEIIADLLSNKRRTLLIIMMVFWGCFMFSLSLSLSNGVYKKFQLILARVEKPAFYLALRKTSHSEQGFVAGRKLTLLINEVDSLKKAFPEIKWISPSSGNMMLISANQHHLNTPVVGRTPVSQEIENNYLVSGGRFISEADLQNHAKVAVLTSYVSEHLFQTNDAVGKKIMIAGVPFTVIGVLDPDKNQYGGNGTNVLIPFTTAHDFSMRPGSSIEVQLQDHVSLKTFLPRFKVYLAHQYHFSDKDLTAINVWTWQEGERIFKQFLYGIQLFFLASGLSLLLASSIGVSNMLFYLVKVREFEIGLKMSLGAKPAFIKTQIIMESILYYVVGGMLSALFVLFINHLLNTIPHPDWVGHPFLSISTFLLFWLISLLIAVAVAFFPAARAVKMKPSLLLGAR